MRNTSIQRQYTALRHKNTSRCKQAIKLKPKKISILQSHKNVLETNKQTSKSKQIKTNQNKSHQIKSNKQTNKKQKKTNQFQFIKSSVHQLLNTSLTLFFSSSSVNFPTKSRMSLPRQKSISCECLEFLRGGPTTNVINGVIWSN